MEETKTIKASMIIEIMGRPEKHIIETLSGMIKQIDEEKGVRVIESRISDAKEIEKAKDIYTCFADITVEVEEIFPLTLLVFKYMPSHIEIISPETIRINNTVWNDVFNEITGRLHNYDEIARILQMEKAILEKRLRSFVDRENSSEGIKEVKENKKKKDKKPKRKK